MIKQIKQQDVYLVLCFEKNNSMHLTFKDSSEFRVHILKGNLVNHQGNPVILEHFALNDTAVQSEVSGEEKTNAFFQ